MRWIGLAVLLTLFGGAQANAQVVALGDSATKGFHLPEPDTWPFKLEALLRQRGLDVHVANEGVNGDTSEGMLGRFDSAVPEGTRVVIFACCGNDNKDPRHFVADHDGNVRTIFARLRRAGSPSSSARSARKELRTPRTSASREARARPCAEEFTKASRRRT